MRRKVWRIRVERGQRYWVIWVDGLHGGTQAKNLSEVEPMARDFISGMSGETPETFDLETEIDLPASVAAHLKNADALIAESRKARAKATAETGAAAKELQASGLTLRDIGIALGMSYQRAQQLIKS